MFDLFLHRSYLLFIFRLGKVLLNHIKFFFRFFLITGKTVVNKKYSTLAGAVIDCIPFELVLLSNRLHRVEQEG
jgi:hypothetical protein